MGNYIGIDFGMQNLKVCYFDGRKNNPVDLEGNQSSTSKIAKNAVYYTENEEGLLNRFFFGSQKAEEARKDNNPDYVRYIKRELQKENYVRSVCNGKYSFTALEIATDIFKQIHFKMAESRYDMTAPVILTVPVVFSETQKWMLKSCAEKAGFHVQEIITEPFAALFAEDFFAECEELFDECEEDDDDRCVLLFDFGASTLDICLLKLQNENGRRTIETLSSTGLSYGGKDITDAIAEFLIEKCEEVIKAELQFGRLTKESTFPTFFEIAEEMKKALYEEEDILETDRNIFGEKFTLKRTNVDQLLKKTGIWNQISSAIADMFEATDEFDTDDYEIVKKVIMTGGTSKIQYFRDQLDDLFEDAELIGDPEEENTVYCSVSSGAVNFAKETEIHIRNTSPMMVGIAIKNGFEKALNRNSFYNLPGKRKDLSIEWLKANNWKIKVYQTLCELREHTKLDDENILYCGFIQLNPKLYQSCSTGVVIQLKYTPYGIVADTAYAEEITNHIEENVPLSIEVSL